MKRLFLLLAFATCFSQFAPLPQGDNGIAAQYPNDSNIASNRAVVFADDFEGYAGATQLSTRWNGGVYHNASLDSTPANVFSGRKSLRFYSPQQSAELSNGVARNVSPELDSMFLRFYTKFDASFNVVGSSHNGGGMSAHYMKNGQSTPGVPADGYNKWLVEFECWRGDTLTRNPGNLNCYVYHPEQRTNYGDHFFPNGEVMPWTYLPGNFGTGFVPRPNIVPELNRWYCFELMVKANTPGDSNGRIACWMDGALIADFQNLKLRYIDTLTIDRFGLSLHIGSNTLSATNKWYDNVVAATSYIGPMKRGTAVETAAPVLRWTGDTEVMLYNIKGRLLRRQKGVAGLERDLPNGVYVCVVRHGTVRESIRRVVVK